MRGLHGWVPFGCCMKVSLSFYAQHGFLCNPWDALFPGKITQETTHVVAGLFLEVLSEQKENSLKTHKADLTNVFRSGLSSSH